ncbi:MAG TPA: O-antigen ligase family protein [Candidatus Binatia bacterium]|jgi:O-antigen ligase|nr:O-antigen ligase family protein [Candidatus Binatia bacterium]
MTELVRAPQRWLERHTILWQRWLIVVLALLLAASIAYVASPANTMVVLMALIGLVAGLVGVQIFLRWPALGLVLLIPANMVVPFMVGTGSQTGIHATLLLLALLGALWLYDIFQNERELRLVSSRPIPPLLVLLIVSGVSFFVGQLPWFQTHAAPVTAQLGGLGVILFSAMAFLLAAHQFKELRWIEYFTWTFLAFGGVFLVFRVVPGLFRYSGYVFTWGATSSQFWNWLLAIAFGQLLFNKKLRTRWRAALVVLLAAAVYAAFIQTYEWRSGWLPPLIAIVVIAALYDWRLAALVVVAGLLITPGLLQQLIVTDEYSYSTRVDAWIILLEIIRVNPILGLGPANYYYYTPLYEIRGYNVRFNSHNQYLDIVAQIGLVGLMVLVWFFVSVARVAWELRDRVPDGFARAYVYATLGGLVGTVVSGMLGDWFLPFVYNVGVVGMRSSVLGWLFMGGLIAIEQMVQQGQLTAAEEQPV